MESNWCTTSYFYKPKQKNSIRNVFPRFGGIVYFLSVHNAHIESVNVLIIDQPCWIGHAAFPEYSRLESRGPALLLERLPLHKLCWALKFRQLQLRWIKEPLSQFWRCWRGQISKMGTLHNAFTWLALQYQLSPLPLPQHKHSVKHRVGVPRKPGRTAQSNFPNLLAKAPVKIQIPEFHPSPLCGILLGRDLQIYKIYVPPQGNSGH